MIKSFKHKGLEKFFESGSLAGIQAAHQQKIRMRLVALDTAINLEDINLPGFRLHQLKGDKRGLWAIDVSKNWRITFEFKEGDELCEIETSKAVMALEAPFDGTIRRFIAQVGETLEVQKPIAVVADVDVSEEEIDQFLAGFDDYVQSREEL